MPDRLDRTGVEVRQQPVPCRHDVPGGGVHLRPLIPGQPAGLAVEPDQRRQRAEPRPSQVQVRRGRPVEAADVMAPERRPGKRVRQAAAQRAAHPAVGRGRVTAPLGRVPLAAQEGGPPPHQPVAVHGLGHLRGRVVVQQRVHVVQLPAGHSVGCHGSGGHGLSEVGLEYGHAVTEQPGQQPLPPADRAAVGEVHDAHGRQPLVLAPGRPGPGCAVRPAQEVPCLAGFGEPGTLHADVRVDPQAEPQPQRGELGGHRARIGKRLRVPGQVGPAARPLPVRVDVQHVSGETVPPDLPAPLEHRLLSVGLET